MAVELYPLQNVINSSLLQQGRSQPRTDSTRSSSSTISSDALTGSKPLPPPVAHKPSLARLSQTSEEQSTEKEGDAEDPANKSFLGKVEILYISCILGLFNVAHPLSVFK